MTAGEPDCQTVLPQTTNMEVNPDYVYFLLNLSCVLTNQSSILDDVYGTIMDTFLLQIHARHAESLRDLNACWAAVNKAVVECQSDLP